MIPLSDDNPTLKAPVMTYAILAGLVGSWGIVQKFGFDAMTMAQTVCDYGMVAGEITKLAPVGKAVPIGDGLACVVDNDPINRWTLFTHMFLHGGWMHLLGNCLFFWVFGNNVEDSMGRFRFPIFYVLCGLVAAATQIWIDPISAIPMVGASGAISGVLGAYLVLYPRVKVNMLFFFVVFIRVIPVPAWLVLLWWFGWQLVSGVPQLMSSKLNPEVSDGVAVWAHIGGFLAGVVLVKLFQSKEKIVRRDTIRQERYPDRW